MARQRMIGIGMCETHEHELKLGSSALSGSIVGHVPEIFDAEFPFVPRGAPAQAWSLACFEEAEARRKGKVDAHLTRMIAQHWIIFLYHRRPKESNEYLKVASRFIFK